MERTLVEFSPFTNYYVGLSLQLQRDILKSKVDGIWVGTRWPLLGIEGTFAITNRAAFR